ncbi:prepilin peptidase [Dietzia sp. E1]|uniref:prepilin peptidase n=1 Tax=Dietzia sp. E1 TaxID=328361 RepID=UPI0015F9A21C|nr:prepilin peptidase [Dietzia sp. E1]
MTTPVTALICALLCGGTAAALTRWMRRLVESDSRWLRSGLHVLLSAAGGVGATALAANWAELVAFATLAVACSLLIAIDLAVFRLPDAIVGPLYPVLFAGLAVSAWLTDDWAGLGRAAAAAVVLLGFYFVLALINPSGLGLGDVKLSGALGALLGWLGWPAVLAGTLAAFALNAVVALVLLASRRVTAKSGIAFGPAMILGVVLGAAYWVARSTALAG